MGNTYSTYALSGAGKASLLYVGGAVLLKRRPSLYECAGYAAAVALYRVLRKLYEKKKKKKTYDKRVRNAACGAVIALLLAASSSELSSSSLVLALLAAKSLEGVLRHHFKERLGAVALVLNCIATAQVVTTWFLRPRLLHPPYVKFLNRQSELSTATHKLLSNYREVPVADMGRVVMGSTPLAAFLVPYFFNQVLKSAKMYSAVHLVGVARDLWANRRSREEVTKRYAVNVARSTLFLATYCTTGLGVLLLANALRRSSNLSLPRFYAVSWAAGLSSLWEKPQRRMTLAAYISIYAIHSLLRGRTSSVAFVALSSLAFYYYDQQPDILSSWLLDLYGAA